MLLGYECHQVVIYQKLHGVKDGCYLFSSKIQVMFGLWVFNSYEIGIGKDVHIDVCYLYNWTSCDCIISDSLKMLESQLIEKLMWLIYRASYCSREQIIMQDNNIG